ncbi:MAG TPA: rhomboid family intramembrane serine protease [Candidatus Limnocylindria bacterium]|nr:rhomboid family intramembrane serine protease [Candidatus Limnocylindria bacterium]
MKGFRAFLRKIDPRRWVELSSPVTLSFLALSLAALILGWLTRGASTRALFSVYRSSAANLLFYPRLFLHVRGHANFSHFAGNRSLLLVLGPLVERHYGARRYLIMIAVTALVTALVQLFLVPGVATLGASGIVFMLIILAAASGRTQGKVPLTLLLVAAVYLGREVYTGITVRDSVSNLSHVAGGLCGIAFGLSLFRRKP